LQGNEGIFRLVGWNKLQAPQILWPHGLKSTVLFFYRATLYQRSICCRRVSVRLSVDVVLYSMEIVALAFQNVLEYGHSDFKKFICDDMATLYVNLVNFGPVTPEFRNGKGVQLLVSFFKQTFQTNYLRIHWTDFHQIFTIWYVFDRRLQFWLHFSDSSRKVDMATNFRVKIGKIGLFTFICSPGILKRIAMSPFWFFKSSSVSICKIDL